MAADDVQLPDLEVIQRFSLAVRGATAPRADVVAALQADLAWLTGDDGRAAAQRSGTSPQQEAAPTPAPAPAPRKRTARRAVPRARPTAAPDAEA